MLNWFELMGQAQGGAALDNMARQFGLTPDQAGRAAAAMMPAFMMGLQRNAASPTGMEPFLKLMGAGHYPAFFESAAQAFTPQASREGAAVLDQLFGSDETSRRVAQQAASVSGVGVEVLQQMLPLMAGIMAGGLAKLAGAFAAAPGATPPSPGQTGLGGWADFWSGTAGAQKPPEREANAFDEMMASFLAAQRGGSPPKPEAPKLETPNPFAAFAQMMETGRELQEQHLASLQAILDATTRRPDKPE